MPLRVVERSAAPAKDTLAKRFGLWLTVWYASLMEASRMAKVDWTGWHVD